ncbi:hypothetical protein EXT45_19295 [Klebsiella pneumoniae]|nr:hypothetical protein EXT45_19295 [Klebsiella pneumoniae]
MATVRTPQSHSNLCSWGCTSLPPSGKPKSIEAWICLVGLISEAPSGKNPEIKIPGFFYYFRYSTLMMW